MARRPQSLLLIKSARRPVVYSKDLPLVSAADGTAEDFGLIVHPAADGGGGARGKIAPPAADRSEFPTAYVVRSPAHRGPPTVCQILVAAAHRGVLVSDGVSKARHQPAEGVIVLLIAHDQVVRAGAQVFRPR